MRYTWIPISMCAMFGTAVLPGCSSSNSAEPGAHYTINTYSTHLDAAPDAVTSAAKSAAEDLKLMDISSVGTKVDGRVTGRTADGRQVTVDIQQDGENVSKVAVQVGDTGDQAISQQFIDRTKAHLKWF